MRVLFPQVQCFEVHRLSTRRGHVEHKVNVVLSMPHRCALEPARALASDGHLAPEPDDPSEGGSHTNPPLTHALLLMPPPSLVKLGRFLRRPPRRELGICQHLLVHVCSHVGKDLLDVSGFPQLGGGRMGINEQPLGHRL